MCYNSPRKRNGIRGFRWKCGEAEVSRISQISQARRVLIRQRTLWLNQSMFARKLRVEYEKNGQRLPCSLKWLDSFSMRNFTNASAFDNTLPVGDGEMEIGSGVPLDQLREAMEDWFHRKSYIPKDSKLVLQETKLNSQPE